MTVCVCKCIENFGVSKAVSLDVVECGYFLVEIEIKSYLLNFLYNTSSEQMAKLKLIKG